MNLSPTANSEPVTRLLAVGDPDNLSDWPDYVAEYGLSVEHVPQLIEIARQWCQDEGADWDAPEVWARDELPTVFGTIGPPAMPMLTAFLHDGSRGTYARIAASEGIEKIGQPVEGRAESIAVLTQFLDRHDRRDPEVNGFTVSCLMDLEAVESAEVIERAYAAGCVDESICGDWPHVRYELGLGPPPEERRYSPWFGARANPSPTIERQTPQQKARLRAKAKRKQARKSRKLNRKRR